MLDNEAFEVELIIDHKYFGEHKAANLKLLVKWLGFHEPTWEPFRGTDLDKVAKVHEYLRSNKMSIYIPKRFKA
jgi:hypothetical protein